MNGNSQNAIEAFNREFSKFNINYVPAQVQQNDDPLAALNSEQKALYDEVLPIMGADNALAFVLGE
ncbi:MAG: hypothetical protein HRU35_02410 [Rickettsiaceae bacterium]|nr:hypothetical protein [Rickettsiaceae bacterium]